jgi:hypothetical protein
MSDLEKYIALLKRNILYGWVTSGSEAETYIDDTYKEFLQEQKKQERIRTKIIVEMDEYKALKEKETNASLKDRYIGIICGLKKALDIIKGLE